VLKTFTLAICTFHIQYWLWDKSTVQITTTKTGDKVFHGKCKESNAKIIKNGFMSHE
jgi:hypothetical protein